jgi:superfamily II DNA or RNA helicase
VADISAPATVPPPPDDPEELLGWAHAHQVSARLDDVLFGWEGPAGTFLPARYGEARTYRQVLLEPDDDPLHRRYHDAAETARGYLHRIATVAAHGREARAWMDEHGRDPDDDVLVTFLERLRAALAELLAARETPPRPAGTYQPVAVRVTRTPVPLLRYEEWPLAGPGRTAGDREVALALLGWNEGPLRWAVYRLDRALLAEASADERQAALEAMIDFVRDPRQQEGQETLAELLRVPAWQVALGELDQRLTDLVPGPATGERIAYRVTASPAGLDVEPLLQKRLKSGAHSKGAHLAWYDVPNRAGLTAADRRVFQAYDDRFARGAAVSSWGAGRLSQAQLFGVLRALIDHPAVFLQGEREETGRLDIRLGRLRLRFLTTPAGGLDPRFELLGVTLLAPEVAASLRDERHLVHLHRPDAGAPQVLLAELHPRAAAVVHALALAPAQFPAESHDALAARLEELQETVDIEFPSRWTRTITAADGRLVARLELLVSGALKTQLVVRPVAHGPVFAPGDGPALVLEGQGAERHGVRRDRQAERQAGHALVERLGLAGGTELEPWCWRVSEGDPALQLVATLAEMPAVVVEWADDGGLTSRGVITRRSLRLAVADRRDWFVVEGGAHLAGEVVPLSVLFSAIREGRRYVAVGARGFARIEDTLRAALARAEAVTFETRGELQLAAVGSDPLVGLVEEESQLEASAAFLALRRRIREGAGEAPRLGATLAAALRPYQIEGVTWMARLAHWGAGAVLADEMGLGKTVQTLAVLAHRAGGGPALVVAPTSVVSNWLDQAARFVPELRLRLYRGPGREAALRALGPGDVVVTSYAIAALDSEALAAIRFATLVLDEAQAVKNASTERARALRNLDAGWRLALTGTPIENHLGDLWSVLRVISPGLLGSWEQFRGRYAIPIEKFGDLERRQALAHLLSPFVLRRQKAQVARELPPRTEVVRVVRLSAEEQALYEELRQATLAELEQEKQDRERDAQGFRFVLLAALTRLRQLCCHPRLVYPRTTASSSKAAYLLELLAELREGGHRALVFSQFRGFLDLLAPRLRQHGFRVLVLDGTTPAPVREERIAAFQAEQADVFLISLKAGGFGLNLTAADTVILLDPWWNPAVEDQATARAHRIGQQRPVTAVRLVAGDTIEEAVLELHAAKRALAAGVLAGTDVAAALDSEDLIRLIAAP